MSESRSGGGVVPLQMDRGGVEQELRRHGAEITINSGLNTTHVVAVREPLSAKVRNMITAGSHDILSVGWLARCMGKGTLLKPDLHDFIGHAALDSTVLVGQSLRANAVDRFGDTYAVAGDASGLSRVFSAVDRAELTPKITSFADALQLEDVREDAALLALVTEEYSAHKRLQDRVDALDAQLTRLSQSH